MASNKLYLNDVGHQFTVKTGTDLTGVNTVTLEVFRATDSSTSTWISSVSNNSSGTIIYVTQSGDLSTQGIYEAQARAWFSAIKIFHGETFNFEVFSKWT